MNQNARPVDSETAEQTMKQAQIRDLRKGVTKVGKMRTLSGMLHMNDRHHKALEHVPKISLKRPKLSESVLIPTSKWAFSRVQQMH